MIEVINWGQVDYRQALNQQEELVAAVASGSAPDTLVICSHPPVVTIGRATPESDYAGWTGEIVEVSRGGRATYHGPNQIVIYPIINLNKKRKALPPRDLHAYLALLGNAIVKTLAAFEIHAEYRQGEDPQTRNANGSDSESKENVPVPVKRHLTGVWVGDRKIASIGVAARHWVTFHGLALNFEHGQTGAIQPCGFSPQTMISMHEVLGGQTDRSAVEQELVGNLAASLS